MKKGEYIDIAGKRYGKWHAISRTANGQWICRCDCGVEKPVWAGSIRDGTSTKCRRCSSPSAGRLDLTGAVFGRLTAVSPTAMRLGRSVVWLCRCECGRMTDVAANGLKSGNTKSCGCLRGK